MIRLHGQLSSHIWSNVEGLWYCPIVDCSTYLMGIGKVERATYDTCSTGNAPKAIRGFPVGSGH